VDLLNVDLPFGIGERENGLARSITLLLILTAIFVPTALANSQAGHTFGTVVDGSRATLTGSASPSVTGAVIASVGVQRYFPGTSGFFQFGQIATGQYYLSPCGFGTVSFFVERQPVGGAYTCNIYPGVFGSQHKFAVLRASDGTFSAYLDGNFFAGPWSLGFTAEGVAFALAEYQGSAPNSYDFVWGPLTGTTPWQRTSDHGATWYTVTSSAGVFNDGGWSVGPIPSPFHIIR
jgi:hypothetical protein